jgi:hypothetical protein
MQTLKPVRTESLLLPVFMALRNAVFDPVRMADGYAVHAGSREAFLWDLDPFALEPWVDRHVEDGRGVISALCHFVTSCRSVSNVC